MVRKGTVGTIEGKTDDAKFGNFLLDPSSANFGASFQTMLFGSSPRACWVTKGAQADPTCAHGVKRARLQLGAIVSLDLGQTNTTATLPDATTVDGSMIAGSLMTGLVGKLGDDIAINQTKVPIAIGVYGGPTLRYLGGDGARSALFASQHKAFGGAEVGIFFRLASADVAARVLWTGPEDTSNSLNGLTGLRFLVRVAFALPVSITKVTDDPPKKAEKEEASAASAAAAAEAAPEPSAASSASQPASKPPEQSAAPTEAVPKNSDQPAPQ
jgi:hypothetical protein